MYSTRFSGFGWVLMNSGGAFPPAASSRIRITPSIARIIARLVSEPHGPVVGFKLRIPTVLHADRRGNHLRHLGTLLRASQDAEGPGESLKQTLPGHLFVAMSREHVSDLVAQDTSQLPFGFEASVEGLGDEDLPPRERKSIDGAWVRKQGELKCLFVGIPPAFPRVLLIVLGELTVQAFQQSPANLLYLLLGCDFP